MKATNACKFAWLPPPPLSDLLRRHVVHRRDRILDVALARAGVHDEHERVELLDLLHRRLRRQRVLDDLELVQQRVLRANFSEVHRQAAAAGREGPGGQAAARQHAQQRRQFCSVLLPGIINYIELNCGELFGNLPNFFVTCQNFKTEHHTTTTSAAQLNTAHHQH